MVNELTIDKWRSMSPNERETYAKRLSRELPRGFNFRTYKSYGFGVAEFEFEGASFSLVPGGEITLGYDINRPWEPTPEELESWQETAEEYGIDRTISEYIADVTLRLRQVCLKSFLIETEASELGWQPVSANDPEVKSIVEEDFSSNCTGEQHINAYRGDSVLHVWCDRHGKIIAERSKSCTHRDLSAQLAGSGFRFPTSDEWEYACGGGAPTLFRWGDRVPCDRYPTDISPFDWDWHLQPNCFGIYIASDPYKNELVAEPEITRGGNSGCMICGGVGFFMGWLALATAYFEPCFCQRNPEEAIEPGYTICRRVLPL